MEFNIPDFFIEFLKGCYEKTTSHRMIELLKWASEHTSELEDLLSGFNKLNTTAKRVFISDVFRWDRSPDVALQCAKEFQVQNHAERSLLSKAVHGATHGGFKMQMPNGVKCTITKENRCYQLTFVVHGVTIVFSYYRRYLTELLSELKRGNTVTPYLKRITMNGQKYEPRTPACDAILRAIAENTNPYVSAVINKP